MGMFTGDFIFVGSIGRPDLLEEAAGIANTAEPGARDLYRSVERFKALPDFIQIWPAHGAGSACGKGLGAIPSSTVGYEKRFNPALQFQSEDEFVRYILADQPEAPKYFAVMKRVNKLGPRVLGANHTHHMLDVGALESAITAGTVIDVRPSIEFSAGHVPGTLNIPLKQLSVWAGWLVDYARPLALICEEDQLEEAARVLHKIGVEEITGGFQVGAVLASGMASESYQNAIPADLHGSIESDAVTLIDVRSEAEWNAGHIAQAEHRFLGRLPSNYEGIEESKPIVVQCQAGGRSAIAASLLQALGFKNVINLSGGYSGWRKAGLPTTSVPSEGLASEAAH